MIKLEKLQVKTHIGVSDSERKSPQIIECNLELKSNRKLNCFTNDNSDDYICYAELADKISNYCAGKEFRLLEYLANQVFDMLRANLSEDYRIKLEFKKLKPHMKNEMEFASCIVSDI